MKHTFFYFLMTAACVLCGCKKDEPVYVTTNSSSGGGNTKPDPVYAYADFSYEIQQPLSIIITDKSKGNSYVDYKWGDGKLGSCKRGGTLSHKYEKSGTYKVQAIAHGDENTKDSFAVTINIPQPKIYIYAIKYLKVDSDGEYYKATLKDDDLFTTTWFDTNYTEILNNSRLPYTFDLSSKCYLNDLASDDYYTLYVYHNTKTTGSGTQCLKQNITTSKITACPEYIEVSNNSGNTVVQLLFEYK